MATYKTPSAFDKKRKSKKRKSRTEVSSSSESDSDVETNKSPTPEVVKDTTDAPPKSAKKDKKKKSKTTTIPEPETNGDITMEDAEASSPPPQFNLKTKPVSQIQEDFSAIYLRKITTELADDLDKVREAQDFKASSVPMLIHALKQGEGLFTVEEKRRVVNAAHA